MLAKKTQKRNSRHNRIRGKVSGTAECPRLAVFKSNKYISVQAIDDKAGKTLASATSQNISKGTPLEKASEVGVKLGKSLKAAKLEKAVFDRGGYKFTGQVKAIAEGARAEGIQV